MTSHLGLMLLFAFFVSLVFATIAKDTPREQARLGAKMFVTFIGAAIMLGWVMRLFPCDRPCGCRSPSGWRRSTTAPRFPSHRPDPTPGSPTRVLHMGGYTGLALLTLRATAGGRWAGVTRRALALAFVIAVVHGAGVEIEQMFVPSPIRRMARRRQRRDRRAAPACRRVGVG